MLARVREFLPEIERSNVELSQRDPRSIDIEHIEETDEHVVEMASPQKLSNHSLSLLTGQVAIYIYIMKLGLGSRCLRTTVGEKIIFDLQLIVL